MNYNFEYLQTCEQIIYYEYTPKDVLKQMLLVQSQLKDDSIIEPTKGLDGMILADQILKNRNSSGILIGSLAESIWNQQIKKEDLLNCKDIDVVVLDNHFQLKEEFEGGIDWWLPQTSKINITLDNYARIENFQQRWYKNANNTMLFFGINRLNNLESGLYIPGTNFLLDMREMEIESYFYHMDYDFVLNQEVLDKFRKKMQKKIKTRLPKFINENFKGQILSEYYEKDTKKISSIELERLNPEVIRIIEDQFL